MASVPQRRLPELTDAGLAATANVIACNDDFDGNPPFEAALPANLTSGTSYLVRVGNFSTATVGGAFSRQMTKKRVMLFGSSSMRSKRVLTP